MRNPRRRPPAQAGTGHAACTLRTRSAGLQNGEVRGMHNGMPHSSVVGCRRTACRQRRSGQARKRRLRRGVPSQSLAWHRRTVDEHGHRGRRAEGDAQHAIRTMVTAVLMRRFGCSACVRLRRTVPIVAVVGLLGTMGAVGAAGMASAMGFGKAGRRHGRHRPWHGAHAHPGPQRHQPECNAQQEHRGAQASVASNLLQHAGDYLVPCLQW